MFEPLSIADRHTLRASVAQDSADTTITVNNGGGTVPPRPQFRTPTYSTTTTRTPSAPAPMPQRGVTVETHREINWGGVAKGVAVVAGVVLVGVVAYAVVPAALTSLGIIGPGGLLTGVVEALTPAASSVGGFLMQGVNFLDDFVAQALINVGNALGLGGAFSAISGTATAANAAAASTLHTVTGAVAAGATAAYAAPLAVKTMLSTPATTMVDTVHTTAPAFTGLEDGGASHAHGANALNSRSDHGHHGPLADLPDLPDDQLLHDQSTASTMKAATKVAHHAAHDVEHSDAMDSLESGERRARSALDQTHKTQQAWADRVGAREKHAVTARNSQYSQQLADDRANLETALAER